MSALAYVLLPVTGVIAYLGSHRARTRFHGLQAVLYGLAWPVALYAATVGPPVAVQVVFAVGVVGWLFLIVATAVGRDPRLPGVGRYLQSLAAPSFRDAPRSTSGSSSQ